MSSSSHPHDRGRSRTVSPAALARRADEEQRRAAAQHNTHSNRQRPAPVAASVPKHNAALRSSNRNSGQLTTPIVAQRRRSTPKQPVSRPSPYTHPNFNIYAASRTYKPTPRPPVPPPQPSNTVNRDFVQGSSSRHLDDGDDYEPEPDEEYDAWMTKRFTIVRLPYRRPEPAPEPEPERRDDDDLEEDGCYCEGRVVLDAETEAILQEGIRKLKEKEAMQEKETQMRHIQWMWEAESQKVRAAKMVLSSSQFSSDSNVTISPSADNSNPQPHAYEPFSFANDDRVGPVRVSFEEAWKSMRGSLFGDEEELSTSGPGENAKSIELLNTLLSAKPEPVHRTESQSAADNGAVTTAPAVTAAPVSESRKTLTAIATTGLGAWLGRGNNANSNAPMVSSPTTTTTCVACSMSTATTISRANSWMSSLSGNTASTALTSPPTSPVPSKLNLPSLLRELSDRPVRLVHSCAQYRVRHGKVSLPLVPVQMAESPLHASEYDRKVRADMARKAAGAGKQGSGLARRLASSVISVFDVAAKWHASSLRTLEFVVPNGARPTSQYGVDTKHRRIFRTGAPLPKAAGYRVASHDLITFIPSFSVRDIPDETFDRYLMPLHSTPPVKPRVFSPQQTPIPSPHRRHPEEPQIRLRPIANPVVLRLRALQNTLGKSGVRWEGRAYIGSLGYGAERLSGVAVDGLKGSALAYEVIVG